MLVTAGPWPMSAAPFTRSCPSGASGSRPTTLTPTDVPPGRVALFEDAESTGLTLACDPEPSRVTTVPSGTVWSGPASATGSCGVARRLLGVAATLDPQVQVEVVDPTTVDGSNREYVGPVDHQ